MIETTITRHNHLIDPHLHIWEWQIPIYLFLGGLAAGLIILSSVFQLMNKQEQFSRTIRFGALLAPVAISLGMFMLLLDLGYKLHVYRFYMAFKPTSAMSWGAWILIGIYPANALFIAGVWQLPKFVPQGVIRDTLEKIMAFSRKNIRLLAKVNFVFGIGLGVYTGVLLSTFVAMHLWNSGLLGPLFLISGASSAAALSVLLERKQKTKDTLSSIDQYLILGELVFIVLLLIDLSSGCQMNQCAARFLISAQFSVFFWVVVIGLGLLAPLTIEIMARKTGSHTMTWIAPILVLGGGLALRFLFVVVGQAVTCVQKGIL